MSWKNSVRSTTNQYTPIVYICSSYGARIRVLRKYYIRPSIGGRQVFCLAERGDQAGAEAYWRHATPPRMVLHDPPPPLRCRHAGRHCGDVALAAGGGE